MSSACPWNSAVSGKVAGRAHGLCPAGSWWPCQEGPRRAGLGAVREKCREEQLLQRRGRARRGDQGRPLRRVPVLGWLNAMGVLAGQQRTHGRQTEPSDGDRLRAGKEKRQGRARPGEGQRREGVRVPLRPSRAGAGLPSWVISRVGVTLQDLHDNGSCVESSCRGQENLG